MNQTPDNEPTQSGSDQAADFDLAAFMSGFREQMAKLEEQSLPVRHLIEATSIRVESEGGEVALTVTVGGDLVGIEFLPAAEDLAPADLAEAIMTTYERAKHTARERSPEVLGRFLDRQARTMAQAEDLIRRAQERRAGTDGETPPES
ncbi:YbaB/EbfC family nucleoid-associated protein [Glycomyces terrestris]|uniref:YbaB/EbfC family DNA-binding protein n=1 Tax=Glycomyces terrestris TaxID=2493553 RepID=A0A426V3I3_9ACTN|nr:YbaB/EbfC family nucleoid-associated protein [Glycomyces terrestris]RRS01412.1 YbaB/EbfC family DNA-binding protein [Glycomyces terrestris]